MARVLNGTPGAKYRELSDDQVARFLKQYNESGEPSGMMYDRVGFIAVGDQPSGLLMLGVGDCVWVGAMVPTVAMREYIGSGV